MLERLSKRRHTVCMNFKSRRYVIGLRLLIQSSKNSNDRSNPLTGEESLQGGHTNNKSRTRKHPSKFKTSCALERTLFGIYYQSLFLPPSNLLSFHFAFSLQVCFPSKISQKCLINFLSAYFLVHKRIFVNDCRSLLLRFIHLFTQCCVNSPISSTINMRLACQVI